MRRSKSVVALIGLIAISCGGKRTVGDSKEPVATPAIDAAPEAPEPPQNIARATLSLEFVDQPTDPATASVTLIVTDENGNTERTDIGTYDGQCSRLSDSPSEQVMTGQLMRADCRANGAGRELLFVKRQGSLHLLEARYDSPNEERGYEQRRVIALPSGRKIEVEPAAQ